MIELTAFWWWIILGVVLLIAEISTLTFYLLGFGLAAFIVAFLQSTLNLGLVYQIFAYAIISPIFVFTFTRHLKRNQPDLKIGQSQDPSIGETGNIINITENGYKGEIEFISPIMGSRKWTFISKIPLSINDKAKIVSIEGNYLAIEKTNT